MKKRPLKEADEIDGGGKNVPEAQRAGSGQGIAGGGQSPAELGGAGNAVANSAEPAEDEPASGAVGSDSGRVTGDDGLRPDNLRNAAGDGEARDQSNGETPRAPGDFQNKRIIFRRQAGNPTSFPAAEGYIRRDPRTGDVILSQFPGDWDQIFAALDKVGFPDDFLADRDQEFQQELEIL